jgi:N-acetylneuraminate synthase
MTNAFPDLLFVFEMANNHQGDVEHGARIISEMGQIAARHGVRAAVKLQYRDLDTFIHPDFVGRADLKHIPRFSPPASGFRRGGYPSAGL